MGLRCFTRKRNDGSNYVNCIELNEEQRARNNNIIPRQQEGIRCFTRKRKDGSNYVNCIEINEGQRAIGNNLIPRQEQARGLGNNLLALEAPPPLMIGGNIQQPPPMDNEVASNVKDEIRRNMRDRATDAMTIGEQEDEIKRLERELEM